MPSGKIILSFFFSVLAVFAFSQQQLNDLKPLLKEQNRPEAHCLSLTEYQQDWKFSEAGKNEWKKANVPGCVHNDLVNYNYSELYFLDHEKKWQWVEEKDWEYVTKFRLEGNLWTSFSVYELVFEALDVYANVYLNDQLILQTDNAFRTWKVDVTQVVKKDTSSNILRIVFESPVKKAKAMAKAYPYQFPGGERVFTRKPQYQYGWDFGPRFVTSGIHQPIYLNGYAPKSAFITDVLITEKKVDTVNADLDALVTIRSSFDGQLYLSCQGVFAAPVVKIKLKKGLNTVHFPFSIDHPQRWWPRGYGESIFYPLKFLLYAKKPFKDRPLAYLLSEKATVHAFCEIKLMQEKDAFGKSFYFSVNGQPVFAKGVNLVPTDPFATYWHDFVLDQIYDLNANMVRVWGGGDYLSDDFYLYCLANGILVWQDFMFACAMYPGDSAFVNNVQEEVKEQVTRLGKFRNIALWCGNNENSEGWYNWGWQKEYGYSKQDSLAIWNQYSELFEKKIPAILRERIPAANYVSSSPQNGWGRKESLSEGDCHYWGVWWGKQPIDTFNYKIPRFMSEYGMQAMPQVNELLKFEPRLSSKMDRELLISHQKHPSGFGNLDFYLEKYYKVPGNIFYYVYASQLLQGYTLTTAIEAHRRHREKCMGTLVWQMNDCWPGITWSLTDNDYYYKIAYEQVRAAFETFIISVEEKESAFDVFVVSDSTVAIPDTIVFTLYDNKGKTLQQWSKNITIEPGRSKTYLSIPKTETSAYFLNNIHALITLKGLKKEKHHFFVQPNKILLEEPHFNAEIVPVEKNCSGNCLYEFTMTTDQYCPDLTLYRDKGNQLIYRSFIDPQHPLVIPFRQSEYGDYRDLTVKPAEKFMYLYKLMKNQ